MALVLNGTWEVKGFGHLYFFMEILCMTIAPSHIMTDTDLVGIGWGHSTWAGPNLVTEFLIKYGYC